MSAPADGGAQEMGTHERTSDESSDSGLVPAAEYVRMSTEHQKYSTENQADILREYAAQHGYEIVQSYEDSGKSGLRISGRDALKQLIADVTRGDCSYRAILVYDVSRWGRFQDADESAYYEYICKKAGIPVEYCAEQFANDGSPVSTIVKGVKRAMAGEYSRELSAKVFKGQCRLIEMGFRQGGIAGYGFRRMLVDEQGAPKSVLRRGEHKSLQTERVVLVAGPDDEVAIVNEIYRLFITGGKSESEIAEALNHRGVATDEPDTAWTRGRVHGVLTNEKYIGNNVYNRVSFKLKQQRVENEPEMWVRRNGAFPALVTEEQFFTARGIILARSNRLSSEDMLERLKRLMSSQGTLSGLIIDEAEGLPSSAAYRTRFGSLLRAYELIGYTPERDYRFLEINRRLRARHPDVVADVVQRIEEHGGEVEVDPDTDLLRINRLFTASIVLSRCRTTPTGSFRWRVRFDRSLCPDVTVAVRMDPTNEAALDYYLLPELAGMEDCFQLAESNGVFFDTFRCADLDPFVDLTRRVRVEEVA